MKGYKTYTGIIVSFLGLIGVAKYFDNTELAQLIDLLLQLGGLIFAMYGRYKASK